MFLSISNALFTKKNGKAKKMLEMNPLAYDSMKKAPSRNKPMNKWLTGISKRCGLPHDIDMENKKHVLGGERC